MTPESLHSLDARLNRWQAVAALVGLAGTALCAIGFLLNPAEFYRSYLVAFLFWLGLPLGSLALSMVHHLTGGRWGLVIRRCLESAVATLPLLAVAFIPLAFGVETLYEWARRPESKAVGKDHAAADPEHQIAASDHAADAHADASHQAGHDEILAKKAAYLNVTEFYGFYGRAVVYFVVWMSLGFMLNRLSLRHDLGENGKVARRLQVLSGLGLVLYALTMTFASIDWAMSLEPHWFSTMYGVLFMVGQAVSAMAFAIAVIVLLADYPPLDNIVSIDSLNDLGNMLMAFVMLWAYIGFSQYLIIWSGNLPEETPWYVHRTLTSWRAVALLLVVFHFSVPFMLLIWRTTKRSPKLLAGVAAGLIAMRLIDIYWLVTPAKHPEGFYIHWTDVAAPAAIGGFWVAWFCRQLKAKAAVPVLEPAH